jgi:hypothetical protein
MRNQLVTPVEEDFLAELPAFDAWTPEMRGRFLAIADTATPTKAAAVVVSMRDEGVSILEWVAHYRALGFEGIFVYTNDNSDDSDALLKRLAEAGIITYVENRTSGKVSPQQKAYAHSLHCLPELRAYEWVYYADADEFLVLAPRYQNGITSVVSEISRQFPERPPAAVCYHWKWAYSGFAYERTRGLLLTRFQHAGPNPGFKSLVRLKDVVSMQALHFPFLRSPGFLVDSELQSIPDSETQEGMYRYLAAGSPPRYGGGHIMHFWCKSFQEFAVKNRRGVKMGEQNFHQRDSQLFFEWNAREGTQNFDPTEPGVIRAVVREMQQLHAIAEVAELDRALQESFVGLLAPFGGDEGLKKLYDDLFASSRESVGEPGGVGYRAMGAPPSGNGRT